MANVVDTAEGYLASGGTSSYAPPPAPGPTGSTPSVIANAPLPNSGPYDAQRSAAQKAFDNAKANIAYKRSSAYQRYGFLADGSVDPNNTAGLYQQMARSEAQNADNLLYSEHGRGFTGGLVNSDIAANDLATKNERTNFGLGYQDLLHGFDVEDQNNQTTLDTALANISWQQAQDAIQNQLFSTPAYGDPGTTAPPPTAPAAAKAPSAAKLLATYAVKSTKKKKGK